MSQSVYTSTDQGVIDAIEAQESARLQWGRVLRELGKELLPESKGDFYSSDNCWYSFLLTGTMPVGWKFAPKNKPGIVPDRRTPEGKAWAKRLEPLKACFMPPAPVGMPQGFFGPSGANFCWFRPSYAVVDGKAWCRWGGETEEPIDESLWTRVKLSEFYAMTEAQGISVDA